MNTRFPHMGGDDARECDDLAADCRLELLLLAGLFGTLLALPLESILAALRALFVGQFLSCHDQSFKESLSFRAVLDR
ncbi:hypothetical protein KDX23_17480 [Burkholderia vietnamiensis]|nr:hypothetical protein [Burkholderia vietnamiensis]